MQACALGRKARYVLVQGLEDDGMDKEEAVKRVQRATADMHAILGALECASDFATQLPCICGGITNAMRLKVHQQAQARCQKFCTLCMQNICIALQRCALEGFSSNVRSSLVLPPGECLEAVSGELTFFTLPNCFELFGFDLLLDEDWRMWLLEVGTPEPAAAGRRDSAQQAAEQHVLVNAQHVTASWSHPPDMSRSKRVPALST